MLEAERQLGGRHPGRELSLRKSTEARSRWGLEHRSKMFFNSFLYFILLMSLLQARELLETLFYLFKQILLKPLQGCQLLFRLYAVFLASA